MSKPEPKKLLNQLGNRRKAVSVSQSNLVRQDLLSPSQPLPLVIEPTIAGLDLVEWARDNRQQLDALLAQHGGILFRGFTIGGAATFEELTVAVSNELLEYRERSSPRSQVSDRIYTSTDYPPDQPIFLHNENSYQHAWPMKLFFCCLTPAQTGGETPLADVRLVYQALDPAIRQRFVEKKVMYVRNFGDELGLPWQTVFQTTDKDRVEAYCRQAQIEPEWLAGNRLRTRQVRAAVAIHPRTGAALWFNHATFFHVTTLVPEVRDALLAQFAEEDLPSNTYYGDGTAIEPEVLDHLRAAYNAATVIFPWQQDDVLMLDNMLVAHGRRPFSGARKVVVGMAESMSVEQIDGSVFDTYA